MRIRRPVQRHLLAAIERIESLHLGGIHRSGPKSAIQAMRDAELLRCNSHHPDVPEALDLLRAWDLEGSGGLAVFACPIPPGDLMTLFLLGAINTVPRRLLSEGLTDRESKALTPVVGRLVRRNLWLSAGPCSTFAALLAAARYAVAEHETKRIAVFARELWDESRQGDRNLERHDLSDWLLRAGVCLHWIPARLAPL